MKNKLTILAAILLLLTVGFGCSLIDKATSGGSSDNSTTTTPGNSSNPNDGAKTGVAECDEFLDLLNNDQKKPDEDLFSRKIREYAIDFAKETIKKNIEENQGDKQKIADGCKKAKEDYLKKKEEKNKDSQKEAEKNSNTQKL
ncbi:MAG TPA: hypothetical protein VNB22_20520 [Pyrinomonadaceae bacterium]|nr:hypothetical protein [Pyrinomonadaceae bacterium]